MTFPTPHIVEPTGVHEHTAILLHGRSSNGPELAEELLNSKTSGDKTLAALFPNCRWVFPTSRDRWSVVFQEDLTAWFDVYSLSNTTEQQNLQIKGLKESMLYILEILDQEVDLLQGKSDKLVLGGISQGMASALWTLLCTPGWSKGKIGGVVGMCGWLPFANEIQNIEFPNEMIPKTLWDIVRCEGKGESRVGAVETETMLSTPVFLLHGTDDTWVDVDLGRQAKNTLVKLGMQVDWTEYLGAENEGHWIKEPEGFDAIAKFLDDTWYKKSQRS